MADNEVSIETKMNNIFENQMCGNVEHTLIELTENSVTEFTCFCKLPNFIQKQILQKSVIDVLKLYRYL